MRGWMSIAYLAKPKNLNGGLVARGASGLPFVLHPGLTLAVVPPQLDAPRTLTVREVTERAENEALVFFDEVSERCRASGRLRASGPRGGHRRLGAGRGRGAARLGGLVGAR